MAPNVPRPWKRLSSRLLYDFKILRVREERVADPRDGSEHPRAIIDSPDWVNVIPLTPDGKVILIRQFRFGIWSTTLEIPGGIVEAGEQPSHAAARELEEETGYRARQVIPLGSVHPNPAIQTNRCFSYLALDCEKVPAGPGATLDPRNLDSGEDIAVELFDRSAIDPMITSGEITHALVIVAFFLDHLREERARSR